MVHLRGVARGARGGLLPAAGGGLSVTRRWAGLALALGGLPALTGALVALRAQLSLESVLLLYMLAVVMVAVVGGIGPAVLAATVSFLLANRFLTPPYGEFTVADRYDVIALTVFVLVAVTVSITVDLAARSRVSAARSLMEAELLSRFAATPVDATSLTTVLEQVRETFGMTSVALLSRGQDADRTVGAVGPPLRGHPVISMDAGGGLRLVAEGPEIFAEDRRLLTRLAGAAARSWEAQRLAGEAAHARELAEIDRLRSALLAAVGHDLRTPLAGVKAAVSSLRQRDVDWTTDEREEFLAQIESSADRLDGLVANLLAMSRLQSGVLSVSWRAVALDEVVARALLHVHVGGDLDVEVDVPDDLPLAHTDPGLLERVLANLVANARRFSPAHERVRVRGGLTPDGARLCLEVIDRGPGIAAVDRERMFAPFQRLDDRTSGGVGLGLAIARGFTEAVGGTLTPSTTPGGGLTMIVTVPTVTDPAGAGEPTAGPGAHGARTERVAR